MEPDRSFWSGKRVCVTGGTGLLGFQIVRQLLEAGARPRVLALPPHQQHPLHRMPEVECVHGDVRDPELTRSALAGCDVVFHTAGVVAVWGPALRRMREVHLTGTRNILDTAPLSARIVHTASIVTIGGSRRPELLTEESPFRLDGLKVDYVHAKREAERIALDAAAGGRDVVVTNPGYLIGPEDFERSVMVRFCKRYWRGQIPFAPPGGFNLVDVRDVALGHLLAAERGRSGRRYILGGENRTFPEFLSLLAQVHGLRPKAVPVVPWWVLAGLARTSEFRARFTRESPYPAIQHVLLNRYHWFYRSDRARSELGFAPRPLADCLVDTYRWCCQWGEFRVRGMSRWWLRPDQARHRAA